MILCMHNRTLNVSMTFDKFLDKYYSSIQRKEIVSILKRLHIFIFVESNLDKFYKTAECNVKSEITSHLVISVDRFVTCFHKTYCEIQLLEQNGRIQREIKKLIIFIIDDIWENSGLDFSTFFRILAEGIMKAIAELSSNLYLLSASSTFLDVGASTVECISQRAYSRVRQSAPVRLCWRGEKHLDFFVEDLIKTFPGLKPRRLIYFLFEMELRDFKIELSPKYLLHFLTLFHKMHNSGAIKVLGNRGLFIYLRQHLRPPVNERYPKRDFRKLCYEAGLDTKMRNEITAVINPILGRYTQCRIEDDKWTLG